MPQVVVKLWPGKSEHQKVQLAEEIAKAVMTVLQYEEESVSVAIEEVKPEDWAEKVYKPDIQNKWETLDNRKRRSGAALSDGLDAGLTINEIRLYFAGV